MNRLLSALTFASAVCVSAGASAVAPTSATFSDRAIHASFDLVNGISVTLDVKFDNAVGLNANNIALDAEVIHPLDTQIAGRLPSGVAIPTGFPVLISIEPDPDSGFAFEGMASIELYTKAIGFADDLRIFTSHNGETFEDITMLTSEGSIRCRGNGGRFSDFMILSDSRSGRDVALAKLDRITEVLQGSDGVQPAVETAVTSLFSTVAALIGSGRYDAALSAVDDLIRLADTTTGTEMDDVWAATDAVTNVQGELLSTLHSLRFTLRTL